MSKGPIRLGLHTENSFQFHRISSRAVFFSVQQICFAFIYLQETKFNLNWTCSLPWAQKQNKPEHLYSLQKSML